MSSIAHVKGFKIGHAGDLQGITGITVVLCEDGAVGSVAVVGGAPGTRETDLLRPSNTVHEVHGIFLTGGSSFGLNAAAGVVRYLEEKGIGFDTGVARVPIVVGAVIFDLAMGDPRCRPTPDMAYAACINAGSWELLSGNVGAGIGATVGKLFGPQYLMKSGLGNGYIRLESGVSVGCVMVVNAVGDVVNPATGQILAGAYDRNSRRFLNAGRHSSNLAGFDRISGSDSGDLAGRNTTIGVVATDAGLTKEECRRVAIMALGGLAQAVRPVFTPFDGDTVFVVSTGKSGYRSFESPGLRASLVAEIGIAAQQVVVEAVVDAVMGCQGLAGVPARCDLDL
jgi:L-aminopeptidase/D-esterase-like protein